MTPRIEFRRTTLIEELRLTVCGWLLELAVHIAPATTQDGLLLIQHILAYSATVLTRDGYAFRKAPLCAGSRSAQDEPK